VTLVVLFGLTRDVAVAVAKGQGIVGAAGGRQMPARVALDANDVRVSVELSNAHAFSGQRLAVTVDFTVAPGWHVYGRPLPEEYTPAGVIFDNDLISEQRLDFPKPKQVRFELLGETLPVYEGRFQATGDIRLRPQLAQGARRLGGTLSFQECSDNLCKVPQQIRFSIPLLIDPSQRTPAG
jgi:DsbC/DsbD-like thiol-disulfide interchange protein